MRLLLFALLILGLSSCSNHITEKPEWSAIFQKRNIDSGGFIVKDNTHEMVYYVNKERVSRRMCPASTYKIFNSLIGLESNVIPDEDFVIPWDKKKYNFESWNQDLSLKDAFKYSAVPYYQELARRVGADTAQHFLDTMRYGNMRIGPEVDQYWLNDTLQITPDEQVGFLKKLYFKELPLSDRAQRLVKEIMLQEETDSYRFSYKTGLAPQGDVFLVWVVGWLEKVEKQKNVETKEWETNYRPYFYALNYETKNRDDIQKVMTERIELTKDFFRDLKAIE